MSNDDHPSWGAGIDIGSVCTKVAAGPSRPTLWQGDTPTPLDRCTPEIVHSLLRSALGNRSHAGGEVVFAVPDHWMDSGADTPLRAPADTPHGRILLKRLKGTAGFTRIRLEPALQCTAAALDTDDGFLVVCDIGTTSVSAAICHCRGGVRTLIEFTFAEISTHQPIPALLAAADLNTGTLTGARVAALHTERRTRFQRARLILDRAQHYPRYRSTTVYLAGSHGGAIAAAAVLAALEPVAAVATDVIARLLDRVNIPLLPEMVVTGGNALEPVLSAIRTAAAGRISRLRTVEPWTAALGAHRIARGTVEIRSHTTHSVGLVAHRIRAGLLEETVLEVPPSTAEPLVMDLRAEQTVAALLRLRPDESQPWRPGILTEDATLPVGRYSVVLSRRRTSPGVLRFRETSSGAHHDLSIEPER